MSGNVATQEILFADGFESADCSAWDVDPWNCTGNLDVNTTQPKSGTYALEITYAQTAGLDLNRWVGDTIASPRTLIHLRGHVYLKTPTGDIDGVQRKLIWFSNDTDSTKFSMMVTSFSAAGSVPLTVTINGSVPCDITGPDVWSDNGLFTLNYDQYYALEFAVKLNTPAASGGPYDGEYWLYVDGVERSHGTGKVFRGDCSDGIGTATVGRAVQSDDVDSNELRYWDDVVVATGYIGP